MLNLRRRSLLHSVLALAAVAMAGNLALAQGQPATSRDDLTPPIKVFLVKADITEDSSQLASEPGWARCWVMKDPAIKILATKNVSELAVNAVANIYREMTHSLNRMYSRKVYDGYKVYITNGETAAELKRLNTVGTMWTDGTGPDSRDWLRGGTTSEYLWISEQMICKTGVRTRGAQDKETRTFDQVVHEFAHSIDMKFIGVEGNQKFKLFDFVKIGPVEGFAWAVQYWFRAPDPMAHSGKEIPTDVKAALGRIFTSRPRFSPEGYGGVSVKDSAQSGFPEGYFYMTTKSGEGQGFVLESAPLQLRKRDNYTGMFWKAIPSGDGYFYLTTQFLQEQNQVLEGGNYMKGTSLMVPNKSYTGTKWKAIPDGNGYFTLKSKYLFGENLDKVLNCDPQLDSAPRLADPGNDNSKWKFIPRN